ncbi:lysophospholipase [Paenibacillus filicis]|uniref:Lysophospholipase n=1 Tax=Paenibacillus filicis TaxID=669464 RepID=A0ABU9DDA6_9BACL
MRSDSFIFEDADGIRIHVYRWLPDGERPVKAVVQISHGLAETGARYARLAQWLTAAGYAVYANDHRGHGQTAGSPERVTMIGEDGFDRMTEGVKLLTDRIREEIPEIPLFLLGHSMGSFIAMQYMYRFPGHADGILLSGTKGPQQVVHTCGYWLASLLVALQGPDYRSKLLNALSTGTYNRAFRPNRTSADWLSRDEAEVDLYLNNPYCGGNATNGLWLFMLKGLLGNHRPAHLRRIPKEQPLYLFAGDEDPVGSQGKSFMDLVRVYRSLGMTDVSYNLYKGGRHEMLNETNRSEVMQDILAWLDTRAAALSRNETTRSD